MTSQSPNVPLHTKEYQSNPVLLFHPIYFSATSWNPEINIPSAKHPELSNVLSFKLEQVRMQLYIFSQLSGTDIRIQNSYIDRKSQICNQTIATEAESTWIQFHTFKCFLLLRVTPAAPQQMEFCLLLEKYDVCRSLPSLLMWLHSFSIFLKEGVDVFCKKNELDSCLQLWSGDLCFTFCCYQSLFTN